VEEDLLVATGEIHEPLDDLSAQTGALVARQDGDVTDVRAVRAIGQRASYADHPVVVVGEYLEHAVGESRAQVGRVLLAERCRTIEGRQLVPVDALEGIGPRQCQRSPPIT